jgi:parallel beta-helix repeat protein
LIAAPVPAVHMARATAAGDRICAHVAAPNGRNHSRGSFAHPFRSVQRLLRSLRPGQTGCLRGGTYKENVTIRRAGRPGRPVVLRAYPGQRATVQGRLWLTRKADWVTISHLKLNGRNTSSDCSPVVCPSPSVNGSHDTFSYDNVTNNHTAICFVLGNPSYGEATRTVISHDRIHDCGTLPPSNHDHGIYLEAARDTVIDHNLIYDNADRGIQLYPQATRTLIAANIIYSNGEGIDFGALGARSSSDNLVAGNAILDSTRGYNVYSYYAPSDRIGRRNLVIDNCIGGGAKARRHNRMGIGRAIGFKLRQNVREPLVAAVAARRGVFSAAAFRGRCGKIIQATRLLTRRGR